MSDGQEEIIFKADIKKGIQDFKKVEKDFIEFERKTKRLLHVSQEALNKTITL